MGSSQYEYMERKRMETEQKEMMCKYKKIILNFIFNFRLSA